MSLPPPPPPPRLSQGLFPWHRGRPRPDLGGFFWCFFGDSGGVFGVPAVPVAVPPPSRARCRWRGRGRWCDRVGGDGEGGKSGGIPVDRWPRCPPAASSRGDGGAAPSPRPARGAAAGREPKMEGEEGKKAGQRPGVCLLQDQRWGGEGWLWGFAGVYLEFIWGLFGQGAALSPVGCREGGMDPPPTDPLPWQCHMRCPPPRGDRAQRHCVSLIFIHCLCAGIGWERAQTHTDTQRFEAAAGKSDSILPFRV